MGKAQAFPGPLSARAPVVLRLLRLPRPEVPEEFELLYDLAGALLGRLLVGLEDEVGSGGRLVGVGDACKLLYLPGKSFLVEALYVPLGAHLQGRGDEDLDEVDDPAAHLVARLFVGRDGADDHTNPVAREQVRHKADPQDVYVAVVPGEGEALGEVGPHYVPVEDLHGPLPVAQLALDELGDGRLPRSRESGEPQSEAAFFVHIRTLSTLRLNQAVVYSSLRTLLTRRLWDRWGRAHQGR